MPMKININHIVDHLFQKQTLEDVDVKDIEQIRDKYPYYAPAQYLLVKKYQQLGSEQYNRQIKNAAVYFTNPHWLQALLHPEELPADEIIFTKEKEEKAADIVPLEQTVVHISETNIDEQVLLQEPVVDIVEHNVVTEQNIVLPDNAQVAETIIPLERRIEEEQGTHSDVAIHFTATEHELPVVEIKDNASIIETDFNPVLNEEEIEEDKVDSIGDEHLTGDFKLPGDFSLAEAKAAFIQPLPDNVKASDAIIPIEPLHTVDYFASQGIKLGNDYEGKDKLSRKLKSFTEWLKTMKKIHPEKLENEVDGNAQTSIQHIAEHSNEQKDTITEAMAEVYARQGLNKKAIETYKKLSLLNPDKRVYFAALISKLNEN